MTEIKFRGKTVGTEEWIYGSLLIKCGSYYINEGKPSSDFLKVIPEAVGQYIGLNDIHGKETYKGDILTHESYPFQDEGNYNYHAVVRWFDDSAQFGYEMWLANKDRRGISHGICEGFESENGRVEFEIIGNIYDNPELIERWGKYQGDCY